MDQGMLKLVESIDKNLKRIADSLAVFKVTMIAVIIALLIVILGNFLR